METLLQRQQRARQELEARQPAPPPPPLPAELPAGPPARARATPEEDREPEKVRMQRAQMAALAAMRAAAAGLGSAPSPSGSEDGPPGLEDEDAVQEGVPGSPAPSGRGREAPGHAEDVRHLEDVGSDGDLKPKWEEEEEEEELEDDLEDEEEDEDEEEEDSDRDSDEEEFVRCHGLGSHKYMLNVELSSDSLRVHEDEDNHAVIQSVRDALKLIQNKFLPAVRSWVQLFTRAGIHGGHLEAAIDLKAELETTLRRSEELDIKPEEGRRREVAAPGDEEEDEDDGDFVEVPEKEGYEACIPDHLQPEYGLEKDPSTRGVQARRTTRQDEEAHDPTSAAAQRHHLRGRSLPAPSPR